MSATTSYSQVKPLAKMCQSFPDAYEHGNGWYVHDDNPRFDFQENPYGNIIIHSWTGATDEQILSRGNPPLSPSDLKAKNGTYSKQQVRAKLDLLTLSHYMLIDWRYLASLGYEDGYVYTNSKGQKTTCVKLGGYCEPDGTEHTKHKVRLSVDPQAKTRFLWNQNTPGESIPCGYHRLGEARAAGYLFIGEGESDAATMWFHGLPFLGISGTGTYKRLDVSLLSDIPVIYIIEEPDQAKKNAETGQGFYKDVRSHLRDNGYEGEIYSIRFEKATGYKDPNALHKVLYWHCQRRYGTVELATVKDMFTSAITNAMQHAIPEGTPEEEEQQIEETPPALPSSADERLAWIVAVNAVPATIMSPAHKIVLQVILLHSSFWDPNYGWWKVASEELAKLAGMDKETFLEHLIYLTKKVGLFEKKYEHVWYTPENGVERVGKKPQKKCSTDLYIRPSKKAWLTYPSTYQLVDGAPPRKHGGAQTPKPKCFYCESENLDIYEAQYCRDCKQTHFKEKDVAPFTYSAASSEQPMEEETQIEGTALVLPLENSRNGYEPVSQSFVQEEGQEEAQKDGTPKLGVLVEDSSYDPQVGGSIFAIVEIEEELPTEEQEAPALALVPQRSLAELSTLFFSEEAKSIALPIVPVPTPQLADCNPGVQLPAEWLSGPSCGKCGCERYRPMGEYTACVRCFPARGYHQYREQIEALYPRGKMKVLQFAGRLVPAATLGG